MQGNNYNTQLNTDVAGIIESFKVNDAGEVTLGQIYRSNNEGEDFDFNHIYFDNVARHGGMGNVTEDRIIAVGHRWTPGKTGNGNTQAMIAKVNLEGTPSIDWEIVYTGDKMLDADGKSLGDEDAQDVNAVIRSYDTYYLATRKGIALLRATDDDLFNASLDYDKNVYFIKTPGSVKHVVRGGGESLMSFLYLKDDFPENFQYEDGINAVWAEYSISNLQASFIDPEFTGKSFGFLGGYSNVMQYIDSENLLSYANKTIDIDREVSPVDGKNVLFYKDSEVYAAIGKGGLFYRQYEYGSPVDGYLDFGNRPVNGVYVDEGYAPERNNGYIYVANGSKLTIFNRYRLDEVASYNLPESEDGSANYVYVTRSNELNELGTYDRIITVAYGQAGLKVFRFTPTTVY